MALTLPFYTSEDDPPAKQEILRAALKLFSEQGLAATTIRNIADESGFTNPALYKHFASKDELALHLFETCHRRMWARCNAAIVSAKGFDEKLEQYVARWLEFVDEHPDVVAFLSDSALLAGVGGAEVGAGTLRGRAVDRVLRRTDLRNLLLVRLPGRGRSIRADHHWKPRQPIASVAGHSRT